MTDANGSGKLMQSGLRAVLSVLSILVPVTLDASVYTLVGPDVGVIGTLQQLEADAGQTLVDIAQTQGLGQDELLIANPELSRWIPLDAQQAVLLPTRHVLPTTSREGLVVNLPERRLYWYVDHLQGSPDRVVTFPVSVGQQNWSTPLIETQVIGRRENPPWYPPASIQLEAAERGVVLPEVVPPGPANPLGRHALYLALPGYLIHGTNNPSAIGLRVTHGCIRLYPDDVALLYRRLPARARVRIVDQPVKLGWQQGRLWMEVHPPLEESAMSNDALLVQALDLVRDAMQQYPGVALQSWLVRRAVQRRDGVPVPVTRVNLLK